MTLPKRAALWLSGPYDDETKQEIRRLWQEDPSALTDAFFKDLAFGTGGLRAVMGVGTNRLNIYTIRKATQGLANYIKKTEQKPSSVFIGYDVRHHSKQFAEETARVLAGNQIKVYLSSNICPTPFVSFGCRFHACKAAVMITASHNPPEYNGYKVYWSDGGQIVPPNDQGIIDEINKIENEIQIALLSDPLITLSDAQLENEFINEIKKQQIYPELTKIAPKILYSPLHGTGIRFIPKALKSWGYDCSLVELQSMPDGNFTNAQSPNPEEQESLTLGTKQLLETKADLFIATDPDADRMGVVSSEGKQFTGNQIACLLLNHICESIPLPINAAFIKTIVTTELFRKIVESYQGKCIDVLTGFKYIGEKITEWENSHQYNYIFGAEESCGYLFGTFVRDKDAISSACLIVEATAAAKLKNRTLLETLYELYKKFGVHREKLINLKYKDSPEGMQQISEMMQSYRNNPPTAIADLQVVKGEDFLPGILSLPSSNVIRFWLADNSKIVIRPSGTEPKVKIYVEVSSPPTSDLAYEIQQCDEKLKKIETYFMNSGSLIR
jgi:phosphomannomutase